MRNLGYFKDLKKSPFKVVVEGKVYSCPSLKQLEMLNRDFNSIIKLYAEGQCLFDNKAQPISKEKALDKVYEVRKEKWER